MKSCGVPLCGTDSGRAVLGKPVGRAVSLDFAGGGANLGQRKKPGAQFGSRPLPVAGAVRFDRKLYGITKKGGGV